MNLTEVADIAARFGVSHEQVTRDHLISHVLAHLSQLYSDRLVFFGGTALARTHLPFGRLSEDIDLVATGPRGLIAKAIGETLPRALRRSHGQLDWRPAPETVADSEPAYLTDGGSLSLKVQLGISGLYLAKN